MLYLFWLDESLKTLKVHRYLVLVVIGYPWQLHIKWVIIEELEVEEYFEVLYPFWSYELLRSSKVHQCFP